MAETETPLWSKQRSAHLQWRRQQGGVQVLIGQKQTEDGTLAPTLTKRILNHWFGEQH